VVGGVTGRSRVLVTEKLDPRAITRLEAAGHEVVVTLGVQGADLVRALDGCEALLVRGATKVTGDVLRAASTLRAVARAGTGVDNIDVAVARERSIQVFNAPAANAISVAELTIGLLLAFERHLAPASADLREGRWEKNRYMGRELSGKTLGLLGIGRIGREVATRARAFGMGAEAHDPEIPEWPAGFEWVSRRSLDELLSGVDYLSLHVPLTSATRGRIGARELALMKPSAVIVNCARGGVVDETALEQALRSGALRGAALDVFATEPPGRLALFELPNVLATPHLGASTVEAQARAGIEAAERIVEALAAAPAR
jgi:D-3-phosphoglycerate dehydrogenase